MPTNMAPEPALLPNTPSGVSSPVDGLQSPTSESETNTAPGPGSGSGLNNGTEAPEAPRPSSTTNVKPRTPEPQFKVDDKTSSDKEADANKTLKVILQAAPKVRILPEARKCNFEQFVNRYTLEESGYAIEYLQAGTDLSKEMATEIMRRHRIRVEGYEDKKTDEYKSRRVDGGLSNDTWIQAVRIQSQMVLKILGEVGGYVWGHEPHTFMRPFAHLIHFHPKVKERLERIKTESPDEDETAQLQCYVSFVEEHLMPLVNQFDDSQPNKVRRVRHEDLWYLFKPGELVYIPTSTLRKQREGAAEDSPSKNIISQKVWRLEVLQPHTSELGLSILGSSDEDAEATAHVYFIDYDGSAYKPVPFSITIPRFDGLKDIRKLELFPIRFAPDHQAILEENAELGLRFTKAIEQRHVSYKAWTLLTEPLGRHYYNISGKKVTSPDLIDGDVMIDFQEAFNAYPPWKYYYGITSDDWESLVTTSSDRVPILLWADASRTRLLFKWSNIIVLDDDIAFVEGALFKQNLAYPQAGLEKPLEQDLVILPRRLFGYALRERKFVFLDVQKVKVGRDKPDIDAFRYLQIDKDNKRTIECLVSDHFSTKEARKRAESASQEIASQDPIPGKGRSLVFLLHGPPGVGKTATVEAVAQKYQKPLFAITSGDLGATPSSVESNLTEIFHLANVWDCILLLDEADVFLEERERRDLERNAVVSVFLRVMEYYSGILFLTTNRPGQLDEAVKSRVHSTLLYHNLDLKQTKEIFRLNIDRLELIEKQRQAVPNPPTRRLQGDRAGILAFAEKHWLEHQNNELGRWNGRQIRNAFIQAAALARCDYDDDELSDEDEDSRLAIVTDRHFEFVARSVTTFDNYMARARGGLDSERAGRRYDRPEHFLTGEGRNTRSRRAAAPSQLTNTPSSTSWYMTGAPSPAAAPPTPTPAPVAPVHMSQPPPQPQMLSAGYVYAPQPSYGSMTATAPVMAWQPQGQLQQPSQLQPQQSQQHQQMSYQGAQQQQVSMSSGAAPSPTPSHVPLVSGLTSAALQAQVQLPQGGGQQQHQPTQQQYGGMTGYQVPDGTGRGMGQQGMGMGVGQAGEMGSVHGGMVPMTPERGGHAHGFVGEIRGELS